MSVLGHNVFVSNLSEPGCRRLPGAGQGCLYAPYRIHKSCHFHTWSSRNAFFCMFYCPRQALFRVVVYLVFLLVGPDERTLIMIGRVWVHCDEKLGSCWSEPHHLAMLAQIWEGMYLFTSTSLHKWCICFHLCMSFGCPEQGSGSCS